MPSNWPMSGYQLMVAIEIFRGRCRKSFEKPEAIAPGAVTEYPFSLRAQNYTFRKGPSPNGAGAEQLVSVHRPQSADLRAEHFEVWHRAFQVATQQVWRSVAYPSHVTIPVVVSGPD